MALLTPATGKATGRALTFTAADASGDTVKHRDGVAILVRNGSGSAVTVTVVTPGTDQYGSARPDPTLSVAAGATAVFGPFPADLADPADKTVKLTTSSQTDVTVAALQL